MAKAVGKGTTLSVSATAIGANLLISLEPSELTQATDDITAIDSDYEERGSSLPSWGPINGEMYWDKADTATGTLQDWREGDTALAIVATFSDGSTQTASCLVTRFKRNTAQRRGRLTVSFSLTPVGEVTEADGA